MRRWLRCTLLVSLALVGFAGCADKEAECESFLKTARSGLREVKAATSASPDKSSGQQRAERYRAYATKLEQVPIKDEELKKLVAEYIVHVRGSAELFDDFKGKDVLELFEEVDKRDEAGNALTKKINGYCGATNP